MTPRLTGSCIWCMCQQQILTCCVKSKNEASAVHGPVGPSCDPGRVRRAALTRCWLQAGVGL